MYPYDLRDWAKLREKEIYEEVQKCKSKKPKIRPFNGISKQFIDLIWKKIR